MTGSVSWWYMDLIVIILALVNNFVWFYLRENSSRSIWLDRTSITTISQPWDKLAAPTLTTVAVAVMVATVDMAVIMAATMVATMATTKHQHPSMQSKSFRILYVVLI